ncbi:MAG: trigger factor [Gammaproteobacteria bacterium]|nr:trigger factor [Gammaproteobacteria bacterium]
MQVSIETTSGLERRMKVRVPEERVNLEIQNRLKSLANRVKLDGFRPGKAPFKLIEQQYGSQVRQEVMGEMLRKSFAEAVVQQNLRPAGSPRIEAQSVLAGQGLDYSAVFEVYPEVKLSAIEGLKVEKPVAEITEQDVSNMLETLRKQRAAFAPVERGAQNGDQLQIHFKMRIGDGEWQEHGDKLFTFVLGVNDVEFDKQLIGAKAGQNLAAQHTFPADHTNPDVAGKPVQYDIRVVSVKEPQLPELDEQFVRSFGVAEGTVEALRKEARANMQRELEQAIQAGIRSQLMDALYERNPVEVPKAVLENEVEQLIARARQNLAMRGINAEGATLDRAKFEPDARRRAALGMLLSEIAVREKISPDPAAVRARLETIAASYEKPEDVVKWYHSKPDQLAQIESLAVEDQVIAWLLQRAEISERASSFDALLNPGKVKQTP